MHSSHPIYRALVTYSSSTTGEIRVKIPALLGADSEVTISYIGRKAPWVTPTVGDQIVVTSDDANLTNVFWLQTDQSSPTVSTLDASKANIDSPTFTGTVTLPSTTSIGAVSSTEIGYVDGVTSAIQTQLNAKAPLNGPIFTGTVSGITKAMVGLGSVDNTSDTAKPVSTAQQTALNLKANLASPTFTGGNITVSGSGNTSVTVNAAAGAYAIQYFAINGTNKWHYEVTPSGNSWGLVESGVAQRMTVTPTETTFNNTPRYVNAPNVYGWHSGNEQIGTTMSIGAFASFGGYGFGLANAWYTIGSVAVTIPTGATVIQMAYNFTMYTAAAGSYLVRVYFNGSGSPSDMRQFSNQSYSHFQVAGVRGLSITGGTAGTMFLQVYGEAITLLADANDSAYFVVSTV